MRFYLTLLLLSSICCSVFAWDIKGTILWNDVCSGIGELGPAKVVLDDGRYYGGVKRNGGFTIPHVHSGTYILSVLAHNYTFDKLRIDVSDADSLPEVRPYIPATPLSPPSHVMLPYPILLTARQRNNYFVPRQSFNLVGMFQNPMMLMMVVCGILVVATPYLMKNMDPEMASEFKERQAQMSGIQSSLQSGDFKAGLSALMTGDEKPKSTGISVSANQSNTTPTKGKGKGKRR